MLELNNIAFSYPGDEQAFSYNLKISPGEIAAITGPSGSGKSTLLDLVAGYLIPVSGGIKFNGEDIVSMPVEKRPISILFQDENLFDHLFVNQNLALARPKLSSHDEVINMALEEVGLVGFADRRAAKLSGGQKQRVALARTLLRNQPILLLDEPFTALDPKTAHSMRSLVKRLVQQHGWHTIIVSHDKKDAVELDAKSYTIKGGILVEQP